MNEPAAAAEERYAAIVEALRGEPGVTGPSEGAEPKKGFGAAALKVNNKIFAMLMGDGLVVKLPRDRVEALIASRKGERFEPRRGRPMKEWVVVAPAWGEDWSGLAREALEFVGSRG